MLSRLFRTKAQGSASAANERVIPPGAAAVPSIQKPALEPPLEIAIYPPVDPGLPACSSGALLSANDEMLRRLRKAVSCDDTTFERRYMRPLAALARYIHLLPASAHGSFAGPGGLFRLCLSMGFFCTQAADERIYTPTADVETRHNLEPRYKYATFLAGLVCELHRPLSGAIVCDERGNQWAKYLRPLEQWLEQGHVSRYYVSWPETPRADVAGSEVSAVIGQILPKEELEWLDAGSPLIVRDTFAVGLGKSRAGESIIADVVEAIRARVLKVDEHTHPGRYGKLRVGHHIEMHLLDAMRTLVTEKRWTAAKNSVLRYGTDGLYLLWPTACKSIQDELAARDIVGIPKDPLTIEELLGLAGLLVSGESGRFVWTVLPGELGSGTSATALRFKEPSTILGYNSLAMEARPYAEYLASQAGEATTAPASAATEVPGKALQPAASATEIERVYSFSPEILASQPEEASSGGSLPVSPSSEQLTALGAAESDRPKAGPESAGTVHRSASERQPRATPKPRPSSKVVDKGDGLFAEDLGASGQDGISEAIRRLSTPEEIEMMLKVRSLLQAGRSEAVIALEDKSIAVAEEVLIDLDQDIAPVVASLQKRGWLGVCPNAARGARAAMISFGDKKKLGFVIAAGAAREMGLSA